MTDRELLRRFAGATGIPVQLFDRGTCVENYGAAEPCAGLALSLAGPALESAQPVCYTGSDGFLFCGLVRSGPEYLILGPVAAFPCTRRQGQKFPARPGRPESGVYELPRWFKNAPVCEPRRFRELLLLLDYTLNGTTGRQAIFVPRRAGPVPAGMAEAELPFIEHISDLIEKELVAAVEYGKTDVLAALFDELESRRDGIPPVAPDADRAFKNIFIFSNGVISRAALRGGLDYDTVMGMSDYYMRRIEGLEGYTAIFLLLKQMFLDYAQRTARVRRPELASPLARRINKVIMSRIYEKITPAGLSAILGMNRSYLCRRFKTETGKTISEYVNEIKITEAMRLLEATEQPLVQISVQLGFSSQNYFHTLFKRITGMTPGEYRNTES
jgi:AraC-like DNA-binding protein